MMPKQPESERIRRARTATASLQLARGTRDLVAARPAAILADDDHLHSDDDAQDDDVAAASTDAHMLEIGRRRFGISSFRPGQALAIRNVLAGIDTLAIMPTG